MRKIIELIGIVVVLFILVAIVKALLWPAVALFMVYLLYRAWKD